MLPTLRQLQYLKLLAEQGSFGRAAEAAHVTQPTLSSGIQELERTLGAPVVDRARSGVILTAVGEEALRRATAILNEAEELVEAAKNAGQPLTGRFRLGVIPTIAPFLLPRALPQAAALPARGPDPSTDRRAQGRPAGRGPDRAALRHGGPRLGPRQRRR